MGSVGRSEVAPQVRPLRDLNGYRLTRSIKMDRLDGRRIAWVRVTLHRDNIDAGAVDDSSGHRTGGEAAVS
jgi:hypothetical protein